MTRIKICGLTRPEDVRYVNTAKPDWCGFILNFPSSRRNVTPEQARALRAGLDPDIRPVGVFVDRPGGGRRPAEQRRHLRRSAPWP